MAGYLMMESASHGMRLAFRLLQNLERKKETMALQGNLSEIKAPIVGLASMKMEAVMTPVPITIDEDTDLFTARRLLRDKKIRHLPVTHSGKLTGILSERDTRMVSLLPEIVKIGVADVMTRNPLTVSETMPVLEAVSKMAAKKHGCLVVTGPAAEITGIFTSQDALRLLLGEQRPNIPVPSAYPLGESDDSDSCDEDDCLG